MKKKKEEKLMKGISDLISCRIQFLIMVRKCNDGLNLYLNKRVIMLLLSDKSYASVSFLFRSNTFLIRFLLKMFALELIARLILSI